MIKIIEESDKYKMAYLVIGGNGFSSNAKEYLFNQRYADILKNGDLVKSISVEDFIARLNNGDL